MSGSQAVTVYSEINNLLEEISAGMRSILGNRLTGLYLYGSLVWGDFDFEISDIDLLAATATGIDEGEFAKLDEMHQDLVQKYGNWDGRIEIAYVPVAALRTFKTQRSPIAVISPGEPFHIKDAGYDWLINWYNVSEKGVALFGAAPRTIIEPISKSEFIAAVRKQALSWRDWVSHTRDSRPYQGYAILTLCRALYACWNGEQVSKKKAAEWAMQELPEWTGQIQKALRWREEYKNQDVDPELTYPETVKFVNYVIDKIVGN